jgi:pimeloyl-ACP methyl ester carboxylesterase
VILVGHSLGGGSIAYASEKFPHKVLKAIYLSACTPSYKQSMFGAFPNTVSLKAILVILAVFTLPIVFFDCHYNAF